MPIVQYKNRPARLDSGLPELARIYKGAPRQSDNQKQIPPDLDYFRIEANDLPTVNAAEIDAAWHALYGEQPSIVRNVQFAVDTIPLAFDAWNEEWGRSAKGAALLNRRCDGETVVFERDNDKVYRDPVACEHKCQCKPTGRLRLFLPALCAKLGVLGVVTLITHAGTDIDNIANSLNLVMTQAGRLRNVAFVLYRETVQLMTPAGLPVQKSIVRLELDTVSAQALALAVGEAFALPAQSVVPSEPEPAPTRWDVDEAKAWIAAHESQGWTQDRLKGILGVNLFMNFNGFAADADAKIAEYLASIEQSAIEGLDELQADAFAAADQPAPDRDIADYAEPAPVRMNETEATELAKWAKTTYKLSYKALCAELSVNDLRDFEGSYSDAVTIVGGGTPKQAAS